MSVLHEIRDGIRGNTEAILQQFDAVIEQEPWIHLPRGYRFNFLEELIQLVAELALSSGADQEVCRRMLHAAARHGESRLKQAFPDAVVYQEFYLLRQAIWSYIRRYHDGGTQLAFEAIVRIDTALSLAAKASLRGFHRPVFEQRGTWPQTLDDLAAEWEPLPAVE